MQFSIVQVFGWMLTVGILATVARLSGIPIEAALPLLILVSVVTAIGFSALWAVLGGKRVGVRLFLPLAMVFVVGTILAGILGGGVASEAFSYILVALTSTTGLVIFVLLGFRSAGYRLRRDFARDQRRVANRDEAATAVGNAWDTAKNDDA